MRRTLHFALLLASGAALAQRGPQDNWVTEADLAWGTNGIGTAQFNQPGDVAADGAHVYVADTLNHRIQKFTLDGAYVASWGGLGAGADQLNQPQGVAVDANFVYVADRQNHRIQVFQKDGLDETRWGGAGIGPGQFNQPQDVAVDTQHVFVADTGNQRIQKLLKATGAPVASWGAFGTLPGQFDQPVSVAVDWQYVYVADFGNARVQVFDKNGSYVRSWSTGGQPRGLAADAHNVYVTQAGASAQVLVFDKYGVEQWSHTTTNAAAGAGLLKQPAGVAADNPLFFVADAGFHRVLPFRRIFRTLGPLTNNAIPLPDVLAVNQRPGEPLLDVDYLVTDPDDTAVTVRAGAFILSTNPTPTLADFLPITSFADGTATNIGTSIAVGRPHRFTWNMASNDIASKITDIGSLKVALMARDARALLDLHWLSLPGPTNLVINRVPLFDHDLLPLWFWQLAGGDPNLRLSTGRVDAIAGPQAGQRLAQGAATTTNGLQYLWALLGVRAATTQEIQFARQATSPGPITKRDPRRQPPPAGYKVNEFNFVTDPEPTNGWWVVPLTPP